MTAYNLFKHLEHRIRWRPVSREKRGVEVLLSGCSLRPRSIGGVRMQILSVLPVP